MDILRKHKEKSEVVIFVFERTEKEESISSQKFEDVSSGDFCGTVFEKGRKN